MEVESMPRVNSADFFCIRLPSVWAGPPDKFSHSSLERLKACPLKYQLERSEFLGIGRYPARPNKLTIEGSIIHECLEELFKYFSFAGMPDLSTEDARQCCRRANLIRLAAEKLDTLKDKLKQHPRGGSFELNSNPQQIVNRVIQIFRQQYDSIDRSNHPRLSHTGSREDGFSHVNFADLVRLNGTLTEVKLSHPSLPFEGVLDLVYKGTEGTTIADYKTGAEKAEHKLQALRYALLWWRCTSDLPTKIEIRYLKGVARYSISESALLEIERCVSQEIDDASAALKSNPAEANLGDHCRKCDVRQFCERYWQQTSKTVEEGGNLIDIELSIVGQVSEHGFTGLDHLNAAFDVVYEKSIGLPLLNRIDEGQTIRLMRVGREIKEKVIRVLAFSEVWSLPRKYCVL
jgi:hypothetical protein